MGLSISGLASKMDTSGMITQLMAIAKQPITNIESKKELNSLKVATYQSINSGISALRFAAQDLTYSTAWKTQSATSTNSNVLGVKIAGNKRAEEENFSVEVKKLASSSAYASEYGKDINTDATALNGETIKVYKGDKEVEITISGASKLDDVYAQINNELNNANIGLRSSVIKTTDSSKSLSLVSQSSGIGNEIKLGSSADKDKVVIDMSSSLQSALGLTEVQKAEDAVINYKGIDISRSTNTISDLFEGVELTVNSIGSVDVKVGKDEAGIKKAVDNFVSKYNELIGAVKDLTKKDGALQGDSALRSLTDMLDSAIMPFGTSGDSIINYGLDRDKGILSAANMTGKISIDTDVLMKKINFDLDSSSTFLSGFMDSFAKKLADWTGSRGIMSSHIDGLNIMNKQYDDRIESMTRSLNMQEARLQAQFNTMESMLSSLNSQKDWLTSQFDALTKSK